MTKSFNILDNRARVARVNKSDEFNRIEADRKDLLVPGRLHLPVTVLLEKRWIERSFWRVPSWSLVKVAVGDDLQLADCSGQQVYKTPSGEVFAWSGFTITLYRDACERYWHALIGDKPLVYVMCRDAADSAEREPQSGEDSGSIKPVHVTIDYDEASAYAETDQQVLSAAIPPELYRHMERFVLAHYKPKPFKKRKRRQWSDVP